MFFIVLMVLGIILFWVFCMCFLLLMVMLDMVVGRVVVFLDLLVGLVIFICDWMMSVFGGVSYCCIFGINCFVVKIVLSGVMDFGNKIYFINVLGIGMCFSCGGVMVNIVYFDVFLFWVYNIINYFFEGLCFMLQIIKIVVIIGSGILVVGKYIFYDWESGGNLIFEIYLSVNVIIVVLFFCLVLSGKNMNVDVGFIWCIDLKGVGIIVGGKDFNIDLQCSGGLSEMGYVNISILFFGILVISIIVIMGVLLNEKVGSGMVKGIGIQVLKDGFLLQFNKKYIVGCLNNQEICYIIILLYVCFYQYGLMISIGEVELYMIFNLMYD